MIACFHLDTTASNHNVNSSKQNHIKFCSTICGHYFKNALVGELYFDQVNQTFFSSVYNTQIFKRLKLCSFVAMQVKPTST